MKWSWKIARLAGIDIYLHATFLILVAWIALEYWLLSRDMAVVIASLIFIVALFACVVLHELGHALVARRYGIQTRKITLLPIGGVASMERMPREPWHEVAVALAGPAVNLVIALALWLWLTATHAMQPLEEMEMGSMALLQQLMILNLVLAIFNLLPAFPMDGGRVLRAFLSMRMGHARATQMAAKVGQGLALWLGLFGLLYNPILIFIALFVWIGAAAEAGVEEVRSSLGSVTVGQAMLRDYQVLSPQDPLGRAVELTMAGTQKDFPVVEGDEVVGVLSQKDMLRGLSEQGAGARTGEWMQRQVLRADFSEPLEKVLTKMQEGHASLLVVMRDGHSVGVIDLDNIVEFIRIQTALREHHTLV